MKGIGMIFASVVGSMWVCREELEPGLMCPT